MTRDSLTPDRARRGRKVHATGFGDRDIACDTAGVELDHTDDWGRVTCSGCADLVVDAIEYFGVPDVPFFSEGGWNEWAGRLYVPAWRIERYTQLCRDAELKFARAYVAAAERGQPLPAPWEWWKTNYPRRRLAVVGSHHRMREVVVHRCENCGRSWDDHAEADCEAGWRQEGLCRGVSKGGYRCNAFASPSGYCHAHRGQVE